MISPPEKDNSYRLTFMCLTRPDNSYLLALVDSGASLSVMCPETARELGLEVKGQTDMSIQGFNSESRFRTNIYVLSLRSTSKDETLSFLVTGASMPQTAYRAPNLSRYDSQYAIDHGINLQTVLMSRRYQNKRIDMILGNDLIAWIGSVASYRKYTLPSGRSLEETPLGTIVHPVPNIKIWKPDPKDAVNTVDAVDALDASDDSDDSDARGPVLSQVTTADVLQQGPEPENSMERLTLEVSLMRRVENIGIENVTIQDAEKKTTNDLLAAFFESVRYNQDGDVEVALPYNGNQVRLANNRGVAYRRLKSLLNQLSMRGKDHLQKYNDIIMEQLLAGYIEIVTREMMCLDLPQYYIPHRVVVKEDSLTTKLRVVLDASSHAAGELSLNECLHAGSNMVTPIYGILIRARCTRYIVVADIQKAFHQVRLQPEFRNVTFFMWLKDVTRPPTDDNIVVYRFTRIPFGVASSPFLLAAYILHCLNSNPDELNKEIIENLYVDNCLFCTNDRDAIRSLISRTRAIFTKMKMNLREYIVNDPETMSNLDTEIRASADAIKLLGYTWDSKLDTLAIKIAQLDAKHPTKQEVASKMAGTFDPLGFLSPIMVPFKRLIQRLWSHSMNWKDKIPMECIADWRALQNAFSMQVMTVPRQITTDYEYSRVELLMFSDASQDIYAAVCYACFFYADRRPEIRLLTSKNKIKPSKSERWTIPKLELMGIECASTMAATVVKELRLTVSQIRLFTDSSCALYWILSLNNKRVWVANRIDAIQQNQLQMRECGIDTTIHHCPTKENPADLATRGMSTADLQECDFWFSGPSFLKLPQEEWPCKIEGTVSCPAEFQDLVYAEIVDPVTQRKKKPLLPRPKPAPRKKGTMLFLDASRPQPSFIPFSSTNSMAKLTKIVLIVLRAFKNSKTLQGRRWESYTMRAFASETSTLQQVKLARSLIIAEHYKDCIYRQLFFPKTLQHYVGCDGLWRWRRNVSSPVLPQEAAEPVLVHADHPLAAMIVWETHLITGHQPEAYVRSAIRTKYWIPMDATLIRQIVGACVKCKKVTGLPYAYPFSQVLPSCRVTPSKPFSKVGLDYLGPVQYRKDDGKTLGKAWIIIYTCLCTRGAILRVIPNNTSEKYILTLKMIFREVGVPTEIYSDNATTFKLGAKVINRDINDLECSHSLASYLAAENINYRYITPLSPWQGGVYERVVGIVKHQMMKECGKEIYDWHGLQYVVSGAQGMVNNRPLMPHARSPDDMIVLRPIDFQCPGVMIEVPWSFKHPKDATSSTEKTLRAHVNKLERTLEQMWKLWSVGYLTHLRKNMHKDSRCSTLVPSVGQIVIVSTNLVSRHKWPLGRIIEVIRSEKDGQIRSAVVRCQDSVLTRSVCQLVPLEVCAYATEAPQDAEEEEKRKRQEFEEAYKAKPILPSPAYFDNPGTKYAPEMFPAGRFPSIATEAETTPRQLDLETFNEKIKNHPRIGDAEEGRDGRELIPLEDDGSEGIAVDPTPNNNDLGRAELDATYEGRSRASLSRSTKSKPVNYVHSADIDAPSRPFTPQCCQCYSEMRTFPRWKLL